MSLAVRGSSDPSNFFMNLGDPGAGTASAATSGGDPLEEELSDLARMEKALEKIIAMLMQALDPNAASQDDPGDDAGVGSAGAPGGPA
ncbi:MAG TPA: hypothetical protein VF457_15845, partial [Burkholderiaceae bacterium]